MEPTVSVQEPSTAASGRRFTPRAVLSGAWATWSRNLPSLLAAALLLRIPFVVFSVLQPPASERRTAGLGLLSSLLALFALLAATPAVTLGALQVTRGGKPLRLWPLVNGGLGRAWLTLKVLLASLWVAYPIALVVAFAVLPALGALPRWSGAAHTGGAAGTAGILGLVACVWLGYLVAMTWYYPALPFALSHPDLGAREAVRRARRLTQGARGKLLVVLLALQCLAAPDLLAYRWASLLAPGRDRLLALAAYGVLAAVAASFTDVARVVAYRALRLERDGAAEGLEEP
jgi:hypothetical protein